MIRHIPNLLTLFNLSCGFTACLYAAQSQLNLALPWVAGALLFDFLDGTAARVLKASSEIGKELDSLADMVSFGVLPGLIWFGMLEGNWKILAWLSPAFSALRLAKFNLDATQLDHFVGLPTPAHTLWVCTLVVNPLPEFWRASAALFVPFLLVSPLRLMALKAKKWEFKKHWPKGAFLISCLFLAAKKEFAFCWILLYLIFSLIESNLVNSQKAT